MTRAPRSASSRAALDLPPPMLPVRPTIRGRTLEPRMSDPEPGPERAELSDSGMREFTPLSGAWPEGGFLVGGAVRDALLGRRTSDYDWVVADSRRAALQLADAMGGSAFEMDAERRHWRAALPDGVLHDFAPPRHGGADVAGDLVLRDLTINAMALTEAGELVDPLGGRADLDRKSGV